MTVITHTTLETDLRLAVVLDRGLIALLHDSASIRKSPGALIDLGTVNDSGSDTKRVRLAGLDGYDAMASTGEGATVATTALTDASVDIAVARGSLRFDQTDAAIFTGFSGSDIDPERLAACMVGAFEKYVMDLLCATIQGAGTDVGSSTVDASADDYHDGIYTLQIADCNGPFHLLVHGRQWADLQNSLRSVDGVMGFQAATAEMLAIKGQGYQGRYLGVDIFKSSRVAASGGNRHGAMWSSGALGICYGNPKPPSQTNGVQFADGPLLVEFDRSPASATTSIVGSGYAGTAILQDSMMVGFVTDE